MVRTKLWVICVHCLSVITYVTLQGEDDEEVRDDDDDDDDDEDDDETTDEDEVQDLSPADGAADDNAPDGSSSASFHLV